MIYKLLVLGHVLGDFYVQSDQLSNDKKKKIKPLIVHSVLYGLSLILTTIIIINPDQAIRYIIAILGCIISHGIIDSLKSEANRRLKYKIKHKVHIFLFDQLLHLVSIATIFYFMKINVSSSSSVIGIIFQIKDYEKGILYLICLLVCAKPASIFVKIVFEDIKVIVNDKNDTPLVKYNSKIGSYIGMLEREIIFVLGSMGQFGVIGFVLTAKSIARFKQLEDKDFAEKYLVGTLLSSLIGIVSAVIYVKS